MKKYTRKQCEEARIQTGLMYIIKTKYSLYELENRGKGAQTQSTWKNCIGVLELTNISWLMYGAATSHYNTIILSHSIVKF
jgi:hypothetical protein